MDAAARWAEALDGWRIPDHILEAAPESPWGFPPDLFRPPKGHSAHHEQTPSFHRAMEALPEGGSVLDVGCGAGRSCLALAGRAGRIVGVDQGEDMLRTFAEEAEAAGVAHEEIQGAWPDVAGKIGPQDVVVCHHVLFNVRDLPPFVRALTGHCRHRVVVEMSARHPLQWANYLWRHFHDLERPEGPTADDAVAVLEEVGIEPQVHRWTRPPRPRRAGREDFVRFMRRRLCLPAERDAEIDELLGDDPRLQETEVATIWWAGSA